MTQGVDLPEWVDLKYRHERCEWGETFTLCAEYETPTGLTFRAGVRTERRHWLPSERNRMRTHLEREAFEIVRAQVEAHRAVTEPIPND